MSATRASRSAISAVGANEMSLLEADAAVVLGAETGVALTAADVECPARTVVLDADDQLGCRITDPTDGAVYELVVTMRDYERDAGFGFIYYEIGDPVG